MSLYPYLDTAHKSTEISRIFPPSWDVWSMCRSSKAELSNTLYMASQRPSHMYTSRTPCLPLALLLLLAGVETRLLSVYACAGSNFLRPPFPNIPPPASKRLDDLRSHSCRQGDPKEDERFVYGVRESKLRPETCTCQHIRTFCRQNVLHSLALSPWFAFSASSTPWSQMTASSSSNTLFSSPRPRTSSSGST